MMETLTVPPIASIARSMPSLFTDAGAFAKIILLILFVISVISWAIMWDRTRLYLRLRSRGNALRKAVSSGGLADVLADVKRYTPSVEASVLMEARHHVGNTPDGRRVVGGPAEEEVERAKLRGMLERRALSEISAMERHLIFLSTTASAAPFLGLLGTVWGIMSSFLSMGAQGSASIEVVGPGIAEALVTTIAGLAAAIPALVGYNLLVRQIHRKETQVDLFISRALDHFVVSGTRAGSEGAAPRRERTGATLS
jgi:biopolymer transport protein TolQ